MSLDLDVIEQRAAQMKSAVSQPMIPSNLLCEVAAWMDDLESGAADSDDFCNGLSAEPHAMSRLASELAWVAREDVPALVAEVKRLREDNAALVASKGDDWQAGYDTGCAMSHSIGCGAAQDHRDSLQAAIERVRALHPSRGDGTCLTCVDEIDNPQAWPCETIRALDGAT